MRTTLRFSTLILTTFLFSAQAWAGRVQSSLEEKLRSTPPGQKVAVIVEMAEKTNLAETLARNPSRRGKAARREIVNALRSTALKSQASIRGLLQQLQNRGNAERVVPFWVFNGIALTATDTAIRTLAALPEVREVRLDFQIPLPRLAAQGAGTASSPPEWNIELIRAPQVWALDPAFQGTGAVVGSFDTGVDGTHPDLSSRYRGNHSISWFDPYREHSTPFDAHGHGTHTTGTAVGGDASGTSIGVAPGAKWIAAKAWNDSGYALASVFHQIFEWFLAPGGDPDNAPDVVTNSWVFDEEGCQTEFIPDVEAWRASGIFPAFASGNDGPGPGTVRSPGAYTQSYTVGATDYYDEVAWFSSEGPTPCDGSIKPDISAPGDWIYSTVPGGYDVLSGTSMATPHISGAVAVLRSINPGMTVDELESALTKGARDIAVVGPDNSSGAGRLDLYVSAQIALRGPDVPVVSVVAPTPTAAEAGTVPGTFAISRTGSTDTDLVVYFTVSGTATPGVDYLPLPVGATIPAGSATVSIPVAPVDDLEVELDEDVVLTLSPAQAYIVSGSESARIVVVSDEPIPDLSVSALSAPATAGGGVNIAVSDTTRNLGPGEASPSVTRFYLSADSTVGPSDTLLGSRNIPNLAAGASSSGTVSVTIPSGTAAGMWYIIARADSDGTVLETNESNNTSFRSIQMGPDLVLGALTVPPSAGAGQSITVSDTTRNQGGGHAEASVTAFYLSSNSTLDAADTMLGTRSVPALAPAAESSASTTLTIPAATPAGTWYIVARADLDGAVTETSEGNNTLWRSVQVGSDLAVTSFSTPATGGAGQSITVSDTTSNQGGGAVEASVTGFYLSGNSTLDASDVLLGSRGIPTLAPGASSPGSTSLTIPAATATGTWYVIAKADAEGTVLETNEGNNTSARSIQIGPDLLMAAFAVPASAGAGQSMTVSDTTRNQGGGSAEASVTAYYLSSNSTLDEGDTLLGSRSVPALAPAADSSASTTLTVPPGTAAGTWYIIASADLNGAVAETNEGNNTLWRTLLIGSDLVVSSFSTPATAGAGQSISVSDTTRNQGGGAAGPSDTGYYLSNDSTLDAGDLLLGSRSIAGLASGASSSGSVTVTIPAGTATGTWYLIARADAGAAVIETSESNNTSYRSIQIGPDLVVSALTVPATAAAGQSITVSDTTRNQGGGPAGASVTAYYLSANTTLDAGDVLLVSRSVPGLGAGADSPGSATLTVPPATAAGTWYLIASADLDGAVAETSESNNAFWRTILIGSDLAVSTFSVPVTGGAGQSVTVTDTTVNQGGAAVEASVTGYYLSINGTLDSGDVLLGSRNVPALAPAASSSGSTVLAIPAGTSTGTWYVIAKADANETVLETNEGNNASARSILIGPDLLVTALTAPAAAGPGQTISVTDTTRNQGGGPAAASVTGFFLSSNSTLDAGDVLLGSRSVPALGPAANGSGSVSLTVPATTTSGTWYLIAAADLNGAVDETSETNNSYWRTIQVGTDLAVSSFSTPTTGGAGQTVTVSDTTANQGGAPVEASVTGFFLSSNGTLDASDVLIGTRSVPALAPGGSSSGSTTLTVPAGTATGTWYIVAKADAGETVLEINEGNNTSARSILIGPDLVVTALTTPATSGAGQTISVSDTTRNQGGGPAGASVTAFFLSANNILDAGDTLLGSRSVPPVGPAASASGSVSLTLPPTIDPGTWYIIARADLDGEVDETNEANNTYGRSIQVGPDLTVSSLSMPGTAAAGQIISISDTTRNQGGGTAEASVTVFYLSSNATLDPADIPLRSRSVAELAPGTSSAASTSVTIPAGTAPGTWYIFVKADADGAVAETNESNNLNWRSIRITN